MTDKRKDTDDNDDALLRALGLHAAEQRTREALRPLDDDFQARMVDQIQAQLGADTDASAPTDNAVADNVVQLAPRRPRPWMAALAASAVAAVGLAFIAGPGGSGPGLPPYALEFRGGAEVRGASDLAPLQIGDTLEAVIRPAEAFDAQPLLRVYRRDGDTFSAVPADVQWADSGAARVRVTLDASVPVGPQDWWFVIDVDGRAPGLRQLARLAPPATGKGWQVLQQRFELVP